MNTSSVVLRWVGRVFLIAALTVGGLAAALMSPAVHADAPTFHWVATWGAPAAPGELNAPADLAVDAAGNVYIADTGNHRIQVFTQNGTFLRGFGQVGRGDGEFYNPQGIAVRGDRVYVADTDNSRVQVFTLGGDFVRQIGQWDATPKGDLWRPTDIGTDAIGRVYVVDSADGWGWWAQRFTAEGAVDPLPPGGDCRALAVLSAGAFFCADTDGNLLYVAPDGGSQLIYLAPSRPGMTTLAAAPDDSLWAYDQNNSQLKHYGAQGSLLGGFMVGAGIVALAATNDRLFVLDDSARVMSYDWNGNPLGAWGTRAFDALGSFDHPDRLAAAPDGTFYVLESGRKRIQHLDGNGNILGALGTGLVSQGNLAQPQDIAVDHFGRLYVLDHRYEPTWLRPEGRVVRFAGNAYDTTIPVRFFTSQSTPSAFDFPLMTSLVVTGDDLLVINRRLGGLRTDLDGARVAEWSNYESSWSREPWFGDAAATAAGRVYVLSQQIWPPAAVRVRTLYGDSVADWGTWAYNEISPGAFLYPTAIAADLRGRLFIADSDNRSLASTAPLFSSRVQVFDEQGQYLAGWGSFGGDPGQFVSPQSVAALSDGRIVVADTGNNRLQVFAPDGPLPPRTPLPTPSSYGSPLPALAVTWQDHGPISSGPPNTLAVPPEVTADHPIIATFGPGGLAASLDGSVWARLPGQYPDIFYNGLLAYAGRNTLLTWANYLDAPQRSTDLGRTWTRLGDAMVWGNYIQLAPSPLYDQDNTLYALGRDFWYSNDKGATWNWRGSVASGTSPFPPKVAIDADGTRTVFAQLDGLWRSTDDGLSWRKIITDTVLGLTLSPTFAQDRTAFAVAVTYRAGNPQYVILRSNDGGITWLDLPSPLSSGEQGRDVALSPNFQADHTLAIWTDTSTSYLSTDAGETWAFLGALTSGNEWVRMTIAFAPTYAQDRRIWRWGIVRDGSFQVTTDSGQSWQPAGQMPGAPILDLTAGEHAGQSIWAITRYGLLAADGTEGSQWEQLNAPVAWPGPLARSPNFELDGTALAFRTMTTDGGRSWQRLSFADNMMYDIRTISAAFAPDYAASHIIILAWQAENCCWGRFVVTTDGGVNWQWRFVPIVLARPNAIAFDAAWPAKHTVYVGGDAGLTATDDLGETWQHAGEPLAALNIVGLASMAEGNQSILYAATSTRGVWRSADGGETWAAFNAGLPNGHACRLAHAADLLAVGLCDGNVYLWQPSLNAWQRVGDAPPGGVTALALQRGRSEGVVWVGTGSGIYRTTFPVAELMPRLRFPLLLAR